MPNLVRNTVLALRVLRRDRPDVIVSSGAGVAVPFFVLGRLLGVPTVYLEVFDRIDCATLTGGCAGRSPPDARAVGRAGRCTVAR